MYIYNYNIIKMICKKKKKGKLEGKPGPTRANRLSLHTKRARKRKFRPRSGPHLACMARKPVLHLYTYIMGCMLKT